MLYFPKIKNNIELQRNKIQLYCNQVYVTDSVEGIVPDFLTLLHGVIDSPDIPLNVSRSYLQSDSNVKKISSYITKKVSDRLQSLFKNDRKEFEQKWDDIKIFINYGMLTQDDFYDKAKNFALFKDCDGKYFTFEEYQQLIKDNQTDKDGNLIYLYAQNKEAQYSYIEAAKNKGYSVLLLDGQLDTPIVSMLERKFEKSRFTRVDADIIDRLIVKEDANKSELDAEKSANLSAIFNFQMPKLDKTEFHVEAQSMGENGMPVMITQSEYMRRMKDMSAMQPGMSFYGEMPDSYNLIVNTQHPLAQRVLSEAETACNAEIDPLRTQINALNDEITKLQEASKDKKSDEIPVEEKDRLKNKENEVAALRQKENNILSDYAAGNKLVRQLVDLALLSNNMLKGEALSRFVKRSVDLL